MAFAKNLFIKLPSCLSSEWSSLFRFHDKISFPHILTFPCQKGWDPPGLRGRGDCSSGLCCPCVYWQWSMRTQEHGFGMRRCLDVSTQLGCLFPLLLCFLSPKLYLEIMENWKVALSSFMCTMQTCLHLKNTDHFRVVLKARAVGIKYGYAELLQKYLHQVWREGREFFFFFSLQLIQNFWWEYFTTEDLPSLGENATI